MVWERLAPRTAPFCKTDVGLGKDAGGDVVSCGGSPGRADGMTDENARAGRKPCLFAGSAERSGGLKIFAVAYHRVTWVF